MGLEIFDRVFITNRISIKIRKSQYRQLTATEEKKDNKGRSGEKREFVPAQGFGQKRNSRAEPLLFFKLCAAEQNSWTDVLEET